MITETLNKRAPLGSLIGLENRWDRIRTLLLELHTKRIFLYSFRMGLLFYVLFNDLKFDEFCFIIQEFSKFWLDGMFKQSCSAMAAQKSTHK